MDPGFMIDGYATASGTHTYASNAGKTGVPSDHFRIFDNLYFSSIGMGTYLGQTTDKDDKDMEEAVYGSIKSGAINVVDTAINYRAMKSEKSIGRALSRLIRDGVISRDQIFISTKNGYVTNDADYPSIDLTEYMNRMYILTGIIGSNDISSGYNVLHPSYIARCIDKSLCNMRINTIDLVYIHNAYESWFNDVPRDRFMQMLLEAFRVYEKYRAQNKIRYYGMATWTCFRVPSESREYLSLEQVVKTAEMACGQKEHGFRFIQLPYNLVYTEALLLRNQTVGSEDGLNIFEAAQKLNVGIFTSIPLFQTRLLDAEIPDYGTGLKSKVEKVVQFVRSTPKIIAPLIGQKSPEHVNENIKIAKIPPLRNPEFLTATKILIGDR
ncbi:MAG TPA: aldo/keto reductase [Nitrososphaeraceae archaeon]|jgi:aryl-alcohol dehydrogenase-like predicted oxidoreductase